MKFELSSKYKPSGDQPQAIKSLVRGIKNGQKFQTLLGVTGSGKTFTVANVIQQVQKPTLVIAPNKHWPRSLHRNFAHFFPKTQWNILFHIMIIISRKPIFPRRIHILKRSADQ